MEKSKPFLCAETQIHKSLVPKSMFDIQEIRGTFSIADGNAVLHLVMNAIPDAHSPLMLHDGSDEAETIVSMILKLQSSFTFKVRRENTLNTSYNNTTRWWMKQPSRVDPVILLSYEPSRAKSILMTLKAKGLSMSSRLLLIGLRPDPAWR